ncbi:Uncharacterised protein [Stenotrophomonas maltophilia]|nr:Uncharacterised protein [Stenotrophomonas maltophilia]
MSNDIKTLENVQPGGRVRLGDAPWPEIDAILADAYSAGAEGLPFEGIARRAAVRAAVAALSAQPSPGGQGDSRSEKAETVLRQYLTYLRSSPRQGLRPRWCDVYEALEVAIEALSAQPSPGGQDALAEAARRVISDVDSGDYGGTISMATYDALVSALAARQPVGEPVGVVTRGTKRAYIAWDDEDSIPDGARVYLAPPAQAVDLGRIRSTVQALLNWIDDWAETPEESGIDAIEIEAAAVLALIDSQGVGNG